MKILAVTNGKGGCGKSTTATALAAEYTRRGLRCLLVDCDAPQYTAVRWASAGEGAVPAIAVPDLSNLEALGSQYELVVLDTPGRDDARGLGGAGLVREAMLRADFVVVPVQATPPDLWAAGEILGTLRQAQGLRPGMRFGVLLNRLDPRTAYAREARSMLEASAPVFKTSFGQRVDFAAAMAAGEGPTTHAPGSKAAAEVAALVEEINIHGQNQEKTPTLAAV